jgi:DNA-binding NarL/FixJ family response regulator
MNSPNTSPSRELALAEARARRAERRAEQAKGRAQAAETRAEQAETRTEFAKIRAELAETRTEQAETRAEHAKTRAEHAEMRAERAEAALQRLGLMKTGIAPESPPAAGENPDRRTLDRLTARQREILQFIAAGQNTKRIADSLKLSPKTVEYHRLKLMDVLDVHDIPGLVRFALRNGLLPPEA